MILMMMERKKMKTKSDLVAIQNQDLVQGTEKRNALGHVLGGVPLGVALVVGVDLAVDVDLEAHVDACLLDVVPQYVDVLHPEDEALHVDHVVLLVHVVVVPGHQKEDVERYPVSVDVVPVLVGDRVLHHDGEEENLLHLGQTRMLLRVLHPLNVIRRRTKTSLENPKLMTLMVRQTKRQSRKNASIEPIRKIRPTVIRLPPILMVVHPSVEDHLLEDVNPNLHADRQFDVVQPHLVDDLHLLVTSDVPLLGDPLLGDLCLLAFVVTLPQEKGADHLLHVGHPLLDVLPHAGPHRAGVLPRPDVGLNLLVEESRLHVDVHQRAEHLHRLSAVDAVLQAVLHLLRHREEDAVVHLHLGLHLSDVPEWMTRRADDKAPVVHHLRLPHNAVYVLDQGVAAPRQLLANVVEAQVLQLRPLAVDALRQEVHPLRSV